MHPCVKHARQPPGGGPQGTSRGVSAGRETIEARVRKASRMRSESRRAALLTTMMEMLLPRTSPPPRGCPFCWRSQRFRTLPSRAPQFLRAMPALVPAWEGVPVPLHHPPPPQQTREPLRGTPKTLPERRLARRSQHERGRGQIQRSQRVRRLRVSTTGLSGQPCGESCVNARVWRAPHHCAQPSMRAVQRGSLPCRAPPQQS